MNRFPHLAAMTFTVLLLGIPSGKGAIYYVGDQSTLKDNNGTASWHDGNNWLNYLSPGGILGTGNVDADGSALAGNGYALFDIVTDHRPNNFGKQPPDPAYYGRPTYIYFGDFVDTRLINSDKLVLGGVARPSYVDVTTGEYTFNLGSNSGGAVGGLEIIPPQNFSALVVGSNHSSATLNITGVGTAHVRSFRAGDSSSGGGFGSTGTLNVSGVGTVFDVEGYSQIGAGATNGNVVIKDGATFISRPIVGGGGWIGLGSSPQAGYENFSIGSLTIETGATLTDSTSLDVYGARSELSVLSGGTISTPHLSLRSGTSGKINGANSKITATTVSIASGSSLMISAGGQLVTPSGSVTGTLSLDQGTISTTSTLNFPAGGKLSGSGSINGNVSNSGLVSPGMSPGIIHISGNYTQNSGGVLELEIGAPSGATAIPGVDYDVLDVGGSLALNGTVKISLLNGYLPHAYDHFDLINFGSLGAFAPAIQIVGAPAGFQYSTSRTGGRFGFDVVTVPEPEMGALLLSWVVGVVSSASRTRRWGG